MTWRTEWSRIAIALLLLFVLFVTTGSAVAQEPSQIATEASPAASTLRDDQEQIRLRFARFEETLYKMARYLQKTEPARAELVLRALSRSKEERVAERMQLISQMLSKEEGNSPQYANAIEEQDQILAQIRELLTILRSEDILDENQKEQERLKELARQVATLIDAEKVHQADTQRGDSPERVGQAQKRTADRTEDLIEQLDRHDQAEDKSEQQSGEQQSGEQQSGEQQSGEQQSGEQQSGEQQSGEQQSGEQQSGEQQSGEQQSGEQQSGEQQSGEQQSGEQQSGEQQSGEQQSGEQQSGEQQSGEQQSGEQQSGEQQSGEQQSGEQQSGEQQSGEQQSGEQQSGEQQSGEQQSGEQKRTPGREELESAHEKMERAIEELKKKNRDGASKQQEEAIQKLIAAKEKIEELLRQLREEERELLLRALEARFQKMLQLQQVVLETTRGVGIIDKEKWQAAEFARCRDAASAEREILIEANKALQVLRADGSSVAFPEAVEQIQTDVSEIVARLSREDAGPLTVAIEQEVIDALEEMILSLQKEMEKIREKKDSQSGQQGSPGEPGLVDQLAELKMLKTLQLRINRRTKTLGQMFTGEQATDPEVIAQLRELADRQGRLQQATYDLASGKTSN